MGASELLRAEILGAVERHQAAPATPLKRLEASARPQRFQAGIETRLQMRGVHRIEHRADVIAGGDARHAEQRVEVRPPRALFEAALVSEKGFASRMKNSENADSPMSAIAWTASPPLRLSGNPAQANVSTDSSFGRITIPALNQIAGLKGIIKSRAFRIAAPHGHKC